MKRWLQIVGGLVALIGLAMAGAPYINADKYGMRLKWSLQSALGRPVTLGKVHFSLVRGPRLTVDSVTIYEDPSIGIEPVAYVQQSGSLEVAPSLWPLLSGKFVIGSIHLDGASINLAKTGAAADPGRWNFESFVNPSVMHTVPALHVRNSRINFKFGDMKSVFYLTGTDLDISPRKSGAWDVSCTGKAARTDRSAQGLGSFALRGAWFLSPERVDMDLQLDRTGLGELTALLRGQSGSVHGTITSRLHLGGPINQIGIQGRLNVEDVHRWDLLPVQHQGWPLDILGRLDLIGQQLELQTYSASGSGALPLSAHFRVSSYLSQPRWAAAVNWNRFPVEPLMQLATDMGAQFPPRLKLAGTIDGAIGMSGEGSVQGELGFHDTSVAIPDSPPVKFDEAYIVLGNGHARLSPAVVRTADQDSVEVEADYAIDDGTFDLSIHSEAMRVASLHAQVALAAVPWLEQVQSGQWAGDLHYHYGPARAGWTGRLDVTEGKIAIPGLTSPLLIESAHAQIDGDRIVLDHLNARAGKIPFSGEYRYEPTGVRSHRIRLRIESLDAARLEAELAPTLNRSGGILARAFGRTSALPDWLKNRGVDGTVQIGDLVLGDSHLTNLKARLVWDVARAELEGLQATLDRASITGTVAINLRGPRPAYTLTGKVKGLNWQSGKVDAEGTLETSGIGAQLLANMTADAAFTGSALDFGTVSPWRNVSGTCTVAWSPKLHLTGVSLKMEDETYTGRGTAQDDGRVLIVLTNGAKQMRMIGTLAKLKVEEGRP